jgi:hypothetical protein
MSHFWHISCHPNLVYKLLAQGNYKSTTVSDLELRRAGMTGKMLNP